MTALPAAAVDTIGRARAAIADALDDVHATLLDTSVGIDASYKSDGTVVTATDIEVDEHLNDRLADIFPEHGVLSEEKDTVAPDTDWTWIIDPIDGTSNYTIGLPYWCVSVALALEGVPVMSVIDAPVIGRRYVATRGNGVTMQARPPDGTKHGRIHERRLTVRGEVDWTNGRNHHIPMMMTAGPARRTRDAGIKSKPRVMGSTALDLAMVAEGAAAASIAVVPKVWDIAAGVLIVEEAGGAVFSPDGAPLLPLPRGVDHAQRSAVTLAGPNEPYLRRLAEAFGLA